MRTFTMINWLTDYGEAEFNSLPPASWRDPAKGEISSLFLLFVLFGPSSDWMMMFTHTGEDDLLSALVQMLISSRNIFYRQK